MKEIRDILRAFDLAAVTGKPCVLATVVYGRPHYATPRRFGKADKIWVAKPNEVLGLVRPDKHTLFLLMTHIIMTSPC